MKTATFLRNFGKQLPNHTAQKPETCCLNRQTGLVPMPSLCALLFPVGDETRFRITSTASFAVVLFLSLSRYTCDHKYRCAVGHMHRMSGREFKWTLLWHSRAFSVSFCLSLSLSHTPTHTHTHNYASNDKLRQEIFHKQLYYTNGI
jgi:hypothetical protein